MEQIIAVHSPLGGVGKTSVALNMALVAGKKGKRTLLVDFTLYGGLEMFFRLPDTSGKGLEPFISRMEQEEVPTLESLQSVIHMETEFDNVHVLTSPGVLRADQLNRLQMTEILRQVKRLAYDVVILDCDADLNHRTVVALEEADHIIMPLLQDHQHCWRILRSKEVLEQMHIPFTKVQLLLNRKRKYIPFSEVDLEDVVGSKLFAHIPDLGEVAVELANKGKGWFQISGLFQKRKMAKFNHAVGGLLS